MEDMDIGHAMLAQKRISPPRLVIVSTSGIASQSQELVIAGSGTRGTKLGLSIRYPIMKRFRVLPPLILPLPLPG